MDSFIFRSQQSFFLDFANFWKSFQCFISEVLDKIWIFKKKKKSKIKLEFCQIPGHLMWILKDVLQSSFRHACLYKQQVQMILNLKRMFWPKKTLVLEFPNHIFLDAKIFFLIAEENTCSLWINYFFAKELDLVHLFYSLRDFLCIDQDVESRVMNY